MPKQKPANTLVTIKKFMDIGVMGEERRIVAEDSASIRLLSLSLSDGVKHSDMRKVYVNLLCGGFTMLCAFFVYHDLGYKGSDDLGRERFDIDEFFCEGYELLYIIRRFFQMLDFFSWIRLYGCYIVCFGQICFFAY